MKILILANNDVGLYKFRGELLEKMLAEKHEVFISLPNGSFVPKMIVMGCVFLDTPIERRGTNPLKDLSLMNHYRKLLREIKPDVVLTYTIKPNVYGGMACQLEKVPYIANVTGLGSAVENGGILQTITSILYRMGLKKAKKIFFQNEANLDFMKEKGIVKDRYELIPGSGVNLSRFTPAELPKKDTIDFVYVGRMMKEKGFELYLQAAQTIREKYPQTRFHLCGDDEDNYRELVKELEEKGIVICHGRVDDMASIYQMIDCTVHPTYYPEGMSNVLLESLACGRPIITTDRPGCREIVDDGINGFVVKQRDLGDLIDKIERFILLSPKERKQLGINGRKKVEEQFDRNIVIDKYLEAIYE
ncbi:MAG: glycosyltransferase family 4 protein [Erysipelotrichaceae bacterium]|nr:glycosyltransferase family 4 protein [Erysipelotrichaceae bacterium]